ncbi:MAG: Hsp33 family molecular chaperone HslO [Sedimentibacter sp.]|nr:Hsp33 family molecular chaperone HslO [Sedimentibacter sp.]
MKIFEKIPVSFKCDCSEDRMASALISLGKEELKDIIEEDQKIETVCHFCNKKYLFEGDKLVNLVENLK